MENMYTYLISYDIAEGGNYDELFKHIKSYGTWGHITESLWAIRSSKSATEVRDEVQKFLSEGSRLMVVRSANVAAWDNTICTNDWLQKNI